MCTSNYVTSNGLINGENGTCQDYTKNIIKIVNMNLFF
jgi:hypothetical protein